MSKDRFRIVVAGIITHKGKVLIGKKEEEEGHPISGQWHFPGGHLDRGEEVREGVKREIKEETGLEVEVHQLIDIYRGTDDMVRVLFHCESDNQDAEPEDDLDEVKWVLPEKLSEELSEYESNILEDREAVAKFVEKLEHIPAV